MVDYRLYYLNGDGRVVSAHAFAAEDDAAALRRAEDLRVGARAELWQLGRLVRRFDPDDPGERS